MSGCSVLRVDPDHPGPEAIAEAVRVLDGGGIIALPSDTVYGLSCDAHDARAVARLSSLKGYREPRPFVLLFDGSGTWLERLAPVRSPVAESLRQRHWPGPLTLVLAAGAAAPAPVVGEDGGIALRFPDHALSRAVLAGLGRPIVSTSVNRVGEDPLCDVAAIRARWSDRLDLILDGGVSTTGVPSTVVDARADAITVLRRGGLDIA